VSEAKQAMRSEMRRSCGEISAAQSRAACIGLCEMLWAADGLLQAAHRVDAVLMAFMPLLDEIDPTRAMQRWLDEGGRLAVPVSTWEDRGMEAHEITSLDAAAFDITRHGIREPRDAPHVRVDQLSAILVPGVAFERTGGRLGRGAGFYDRYLSRVSPTCAIIGVCHRVQVVPSVPCDPHDRPVKHIVAV
jgi:5-formyltetrahydrofolate cyclo-ligase